MLGIPKQLVWVGAAALALALLVSPAAAAEEDYAGDVEKLEGELDDIVQKYSEGENASDEITTFIQKDWENVDYHEAVETEHPKKYAAIWTEINGLKKAVESGAPESDVSEKAEGVKTALRDGLEALEEGAPTESGETEASGGDDVEATVDRIRSDLDRAVATYGEGDVEGAKQIVSETYLSNFEGLEGDLIEEDPDLVTELEIDFNAELPGLMDEGASVDEVRAKTDEMNGKLDRVEKLLVEDGGESQVFGTEEPPRVDDEETQGAGDNAAPGPGVVVAIAAFAAALVAGRRFR